MQWKSPLFYWEMVYPCLITTDSCRESLSPSFLEPPFRYCYVSLHCEMQLATWDTCLGSGNTFTIPCTNLLTSRIWLMCSVNLFTVILRDFISNELNMTTNFSPDSQPLSQKGLLFGHAAQWTYALLPSCNSVLTAHKSETFYYYY